MQSVNVDTELVDRRTWIGGSDAAAIVGRSPWSTPLKTYLEKVSDEPVLMNDDNRTETMRLGKVVEQSLCEEACRRLQAELLELSVRKRAQDRPYIAAEADCLVRLPGEAGTKAVLEIKTTGFGSDWEHGIPEYYEPQLYVQAHVHDVRCVIACPLVHQGHRWELQMHAMEIQPGPLEAILGDLDDFWQRVQERRPPSPEVGEALLRWPRATGEFKVATEGELILLEDWSRLNAEIEKLKEQRDEVRHGIQVAVSKHQGLVSPDGKVLCTWRGHDRTSLDSKRLKKEDPELYERYSKTTHVRPLLNKVRT